MTLDKLILALQRAEGPSRALDEEIALACGWTRKPDHSCSWLWMRPDGQGWYRDSDTPPWFTSSIDAALTLVPEGFWWEVTSPFGEVRRARASIYTKSNCVGYARHKTPAIAICIAALEARKS